MPVTSSSDPAPIVPPRPSEAWVIGLVGLNVAVTTWSYGGMASWAPRFYLPCALLTAIVSLAFGWVEARRRHQRQGGSTHWVRWRAWLPLGLVVLLIGASLLNPSHLPLEDGKAGWADRPGWISWLPATVDQHRTLIASMPWLTLFLVGGALRQAGISRLAMRWLWAALLLHGVILAMVGVFFHLRDPNMILGTIRDRNGYHFASFVYRNHWAAYAVLLVTTGIGFGFSALRAWLNGKGAADRMLPGFGAALLVAITVPIPGSRSGVAMVVFVFLLAIGLAAFCWLQAQRKSKRRQPRWLGLVVAMVILIGLGTGYRFNRVVLHRHWQRTVQQFESMSHGAGDLRISLTRDTLRMAADRPVWGWGVGIYEVVFPIYQGKYLRDAQGKISGRLVHAHNDWAHTWAEQGWLGGLTFFVPLGVVFWQRRQARSWLVRWVTIGAGLILLYAWVDFPLHNPAVLLLWASLIVPKDD